MTSLSVILPANIADASNEAAKKLGISRTAFIRKAIVHELDNFKAQLEETEIIRSFNAMKKSKKYLKEAEDIVESMFSDLPKEKDEWWSKKKY
jgi:metal-responsive CopG/Arc/MetJ family transcriptional regulator